MRRWPLACGDRGAIAFVQQRLAVPRWQRAEGRLVSEDEDPSAGGTLGMDGGAVRIRAAQWQLGVVNSGTLGMDDGTVR